MFDGNSLCGAAFRYARWLRETGRWDEMARFSAVIHPAVGRLAGRSRTKVTDLTPLIIAWSYHEATRHGLAENEVAAAWGSFRQYLDDLGLNLALPDATAAHLPRASV